MTKILLVDDDPDILFIAATRLERDGRYEVVRAAGGREALEQIDREIPDAILMDYMMPDLDGTKLMLELKARGETRDVPVIFFSARVDSASVEHFMELGAKGVIPKPFDARELSGNVERILLS